jgi:Fur family transcriptional regulator, ferric uptake regulator
MGRQNRVTRQKKLIGQELKRITSFFNAEELYDRVRKKDRDIGIATVYRYLNEAKGNGELYTYTCDRKTVYSRGKKSHCHFVCEKTGKVIHFEIGNIDFLKDKLPGTITSFQLEVRGVCNTCEKKDN